MDSPLDEAARPGRVRALRGRIPAPLHERTVAMLEASPPLDSWRRTLSFGLLLLGAGLCGAAVVYAVAFNWQAMGRAERLTLPLVLMTGLALGGWRLGAERLGGQVLLSLATLGVGIALLVYGQTYQTGADAWQLFATWTLLAVPWVLVARFAPLALAWVLLLNVAFATLWETHGPFGMRTREVAGAALTSLGNAAVLVVWERWGERVLTAGDGRWGPRILAVFTLLPVTGAAWWAVLETDRQAVIASISLTTLIALVLAMHAVYRHRRRDLFMLTAVAFSVVSLLVVGGARFVFRVSSVSSGSVLLLGLWVLLLVAGAGAWLRARHKEGGAS